MQLAVCPGLRPAMCACGGRALARLHGRLPGQLRSRCCRRPVAAGCRLLGRSRPGRNPAPGAAAVAVCRPRPRRRVQARTWPPRSVTGRAARMKMEASRCWPVASSMAAMALEQRRAGRRAASAPIADEHRKKPGRGCQGAGGLPAQRVHRARRVGRDLIGDPLSACAVSGTGRADAGDQRGGEQFGPGGGQARPGGLVGRAGRSRPGRTPVPGPSRTSSERLGRAGPGG